MRAGPPKSGQHFTRSWAFFVAAAAAAATAAVVVVAAVVVGAVLESLRGAVLFT